MNFASFMDKMDERRWFRSIVCLLPGILLTKLATKIGASIELKLVCDLLLAGGVLIFLFWRKASRYLRGTEEEEIGGGELPENVMSEQEVRQSTMDDLIAVYHGDVTKATNAMMLEMEFDPEVGAARAIDLATRRRLAEMRIAAGGPHAAARVTNQSGN